MKTGLIRAARSGLLSLLPAFFAFTGLQAQSDTLSGQSEAVIVTATRTERKFSNVAVPVTLIDKKQIEAAQLRRLNELLQEQTGIFVTSGSGTGGFGGGIFGNGAQLQGMSPDYTLILINGEPLIGRQGGTVNLARLGLSHIRKIEIIKGPSSSLYGSEAMGGVINIITELPARSQVETNIKAGGYGLLDANLAGTFSGRNTKLTLSGNHFRMGAIDFDKNSFGNQQDPFRSQTAQMQLSHQFGARTRLLAYGRFFSESSDNRYEVADENIQLVRVAGDTRVRDANLNTSLQHVFKPGLSTTLRLYGTDYQSRQALNLEKDGTPYYADDFRQQFYRIENQTDISLPQGNLLTLGAGYVYEQLNTTRYEGMRDNGIAYAFVQNEWKPRENFNLIAGLRYDDNRAYASRVSPKLAARYSPNSRLKLMASYGAGFKAPDFRQLYLSFINNASGGYTLFGANEISVQRLQQLQQQGFVSTILPRASDLALLKPEVSHGINVGAHYSFSERWQGDINFFNNEIGNQILFDVVALRPNGSQVFSYFNVARSFTRGAEMNLQFRPAARWQLSGGYQLLFTGDKDVLEQIKAGTVFGRDPERGLVSRLRRTDYLGLPGRSRHMANFKVLYGTADGKWQATVRAVYRSRWGTFDQDGNGIINRRDETARALLLLNANLTRAIQQRTRLTVGVENILNHRDAANLPNIPGVNAYISFSYLFQQNKQS